MKLTVQEAYRMRATGETIEFVVHPSLLPQLVAWLDEHEIDLSEGPAHEQTNGTQLRWFIAVPRDPQGVQVQQEQP